MSFTFDPYKLGTGDVTDLGEPSGARDVIMTNPTALDELEAYWASLPRTRGVPRRKDVDPVAMGSLLEDSFILERVAPGVARLRVAGRNLATLIGMEPRGLPLTALLLPPARAAMAQHIEAAFAGPNIVELSLTAPRAIGQPRLQGKIIMLPLLDDHGQVNRVLGALVMSGRRGLGGRRFALSHEGSARVDPVTRLHAVPEGASRLRVVAGGTARKIAEKRPALRLVVDNAPR